MSSNKEKAADFLAKRRAAAKKAEPQEARRGNSDTRGPPATHRKRIRSVSLHAPAPRSPISSGAADLCGSSRGRTRR